MSVPFEERKIEVDGLSTHYLTADTGPPLLLLHGAGDNALDWRWVLPALATTHQIYAPDLPCSPDSARPTADYSSGFFERFVVSFLDALDIESAAVIGNSIGGLKKPETTLGSLGGTSERSPSDTDASTTRSLRQIKKHKAIHLTSGKSCSMNFPDKVPK